MYILPIITTVAMYFLVSLSATTLLISSVILILLGLIIVCLFLLFTDILRTSQDEMSKEDVSFAKRWMADFRRKYLCINIINSMILLGLVLVIQPVQILVVLFNMSILTGIFIMLMHVNEHYGEDIHIFKEDLEKDE